jgi:hypothetical protein
MLSLVARKGTSGGANATTGIFIHGADIYHFTHRRIRVRGRPRRGAARPTRPQPGLLPSALRPPLCARRPRPRPRPRGRARDGARAAQLRARAPLSHPAPLSVPSPIFPQPAHLVGDTMRYSKHINLKKVALTPFDVHTGAPTGGAGASAPQLTLRLRVWPAKSKAVTGPLEALQSAAGPYSFAFSKDAKTRSGTLNNGVRVMAGKVKWPGDAKPSKLAEPGKGAIFHLVTAGSVEVGGCRRG